MFQEFQDVPWFSNGQQGVSRVAIIEFRGSRWHLRDIPEDFRDSRGFPWSFIDVPWCYNGFQWVSGAIQKNSGMFRRLLGSLRDIPWAFYGSSKGFEGTLGSFKGNGWAVMNVLWSLEGVKRCSRGIPKNSG